MVNQQSQSVVDKLHPKDEKVSSQPANRDPENKIKAYLAGNGKYNISKNTHF